MLLARASFVPHHEHEEAELVAVAEAYMGALVSNGQVCGEYVKGWSDGILQVYAQLAHRTAAYPRHLSVWGEHHLNAVRLQFGSEPVWEILDDNISVRVPTWKSASTIYLYTHALTEDSPLYHGERGTPLPLHLLPVTERQREEIVAWSRLYRYLDGLWIEGECLADSAYQELADPIGQVAQEGRQICAAVETCVRKPVFYYLLHHYGSSAYEATRPCPGCGQAWRVEDSPAPSLEPFLRFHYRCERCRLVSHQAVAVDDMHDPVRRGCETD